MKSANGFTWIETLVTACVAVILAGFAWAGLQNSAISCKMTRVLSNMKQLHLATQSMVQDGQTTGDKNLGWPGDRDGTFTNWASKIVPAYLGTNDLCKMLSLEGRVIPLGKLPTANTNALLIYQVREENDGSFVFLTSANFTNTPSGGLPPLANAKPYGSKGFAVFRKGGDGALLLGKQAGNTNLVGNFVPLCK